MKFSIETPCNLTSIDMSCPYGLHIMDYTGGQTLYSDTSLISLQISNTESKSIPLPSLPDNVSPLNLSNIRLYLFFKKQHSFTYIISLNHYNI